MKEVELFKNRIADTKVIIRIVKNSHIPAPEKRYQINVLKEIIEANRQLIGILEK